MPTDAARRRKEIGRRIRRKRVAAGHTQAQLADALGLRSYRLSRWENGYDEPSTRALQHIAFALGCAVTDLLPEGNHHD